MLLEFTRGGRNLNMDKNEKTAIINTKDFFFQANYCPSEGTSSITAHNYFNTHNYTIDEEIADRALAINIIRYLSTIETEGEIIPYEEIKSRVIEEFSQI